MSSRRLRILAAGGKAQAVAGITIRGQLAYKTDFLLRSVFLLFILFVFVQLWTAAYDGDGTRSIAGFTLKMIIWYLVFTEALTMAAPHLCGKIEEEVKNGDIAVKLIKPMSYVGFHYAAFLSESLFRFCIHLGAGMLIAWPLIGAPDFGPGWLGMLALVPGALTIAFLLNMIVALLAFWVEETRGMEFVLNKLQFTIGGMLLPIDLMPDWLQRICAWLPFQATLYYPARMGVRFDAALLGTHCLVQAGWLIILSGAVIWMYKRGVKRLHVNGG